LESGGFSRWGDLKKLLPQGPRPKFFLAVTQG